MNLRGIRQLHRNDTILPSCRTKSAVGILSIILSSLFGGASGLVIRAGSKTIWKAAHVLGVITMVDFPLMR
jgi:hypothetical protein